MITSDQADRLEGKIDRLLEYLDKFGPLIERFIPGGPSGRAVAMFTRKKP